MTNKNMFSVGCKGENEKKKILYFFCVEVW